MIGSAGPSRNQRLIGFYMDQLTQWSVNLFDGRVDALTSFYGDCFDGCETCSVIVDVPAVLAAKGVTPSVYMIYREAKFVLDSDELESERLDRVWVQLHAHLATGHTHRNALELDRMERRNTEVRRRVLAVRDAILTNGIRLSAHLDHDQYTRARKLGDDVLHDIVAELEEIIDSYKHALSPL